MRTILRDYSRYFIGPGYADTFAQGVLALERNWRGPALTNAGIATTLAQFQTLEKSASPRDKLNWRFQQALYRAYYDAYVRCRLLYETQLEEQALAKLRDAKTLGAALAMREAETILDRAVTQRTAVDYRARVFELAEALYQSIRMQLSVERVQGHLRRPGRQPRHARRTAERSAVAAGAVSGDSPARDRSGTARADRRDRELDQSRTRRLL